MTRDDLRRILARAARDGVITDAQAIAILVTYDSGALDLSTLPTDVRDSLEGRGSLGSKAIAVAALVLLARSRESAASGWAYDVARRRYVNPRAFRIPDVEPAPGEPVRRLRLVPPGPVSPPDVRRIVDVAIERSESEIVAAGGELTAERVSLSGWFATMEEMIATRFTSAASIAVGGVSQLTDADRLFVRDRIMEQYDALDGFAADIQAGRYGLPPSGGAYENRLRQYHRAFRQMYEDMRGRRAEADGFDMEQWFLGVADHCRTNSDRMGCIERSALGRQPVGVLPGQGRCVCLHNCKCYRRYYRSGAAA